MGLFDSPLVEYIHKPCGTRLDSERRCPGCGLLFSYTSPDDHVERHILRET